MWKGKDVVERGKRKGELVCSWAIRSPALSCLSPKESTRLLSLVESQR